jgi:hypothetical protein
LVQDQDPSAPGSSSSPQLRLDGGIIIMSHNFYLLGVTVFLITIQPALALVHGLVSLFKGAAAKSAQWLRQRVAARDKRQH